MLTMKQMIRQLHISYPPNATMCILGKKYPLDETEFRVLKLPGRFEPERAGNRMKLPVPETWETFLSAKGNTAETWEELIDNRKLPFMAMLRNLRNLLLTGVSYKHHRWVLSKLTDEKTIANSRQFPFAFFSAYEAVKIDLEALKEQVKAEKEKQSSARQNKVVTGGKPVNQETLGAGRGAAGRGRGGSAPVGPGGRGRGTPVGRGRGTAELSRERRGGGRERRPVKLPEGKVEGVEEEKRREKKVIIPKRMPDQALIEKYKEALDTAVKFATIHNVKPIRGSTVVFCSVSDSMKNACKTAKGLGAVNKLQEVGILLGLMCKYMCEECDFRIFSSPASSSKCHLKIDLQEGTILDNMHVVLEKASSGELGGDNQFPFDYFEELIEQKKKVDNIIVLSDSHVAPGVNEMKEAGGEKVGGISGILEKYRQEVNPDLLYVSVNLGGAKFIQRKAENQHPNNVLISGFSAAILRYIAERGDGNQLQSVDNIDQEYGLDKLSKEKNERVGNNLLSAKERKRRQRRVEEEAERTEKLEERNSLVSKLESAKSGKFRNARVFVSSTFLDMHGERDMLLKYVFPELKKRCAAKRINFFGVDLRWGLTSEETSNALSICLNEVDRCRPFFVGLLGGRYGWVPETYELPDQPQFDWVKSVSPGKSITEMEMLHGALRDPSRSESFFYLRDPSFELEKVPAEHRQVFVETNESSSEKLLKLKQKIIQELHSSRVFNYTAEWGGVHDSKPMAINLNKLREKITEDLWQAIQRVFPEQLEPRNPLQIEAEQHEAYLHNKCANFVGRKFELQALYDFVQQDTSLQLNGPFVVHGNPGEGKNLFSFFSF